MGYDRRSVLRGAAALGAVSLSGCGGDGSENGEDCPGLPQEPDYAGWFDDTSNYQETCDFRASDTVDVRVGARGNDAYWAYEPAAVAISPGATVRWEWTGRGGTHDVQENNGVFDSGRPVDSEEATFEITFSEPGVYKYFCSPHRTQGMKGAVFVALE